MADIIQSFPSAGGSASYPEGGATGQALVKKSDANNDVEWKTIDVEKDTVPTENSTNAVQSGGVYTALADKVDKVENATNGNFASLDENGNLTDSGNKASDFASASDLDNKEDKFRLTEMPTASETNVDKIVQYIGTTTQTYTNGYYYKCVLDDNIYKWIESPTMDMSGSTKDSRIKTEIIEFGIDVEDLIAKPYIISRYIIPSFNSISWDTVSEILDGYYSGTITLDEIQDSWKLGDYNTLSVSAIPAMNSNLTDTHAAQDVEMMIVAFNHYNKSDNSGKALLTLHMKDCFKEKGVFSTGTYSSTQEERNWNYYPRKTWCANYVYAALPNSVKESIKTVNRITPYHKTTNSWGTSSGTDTIFFPTRKELTGIDSMSAGTLYPYYTTNARRIKKVNGTASRYWGVDMIGGGPGYYQVSTVASNGSDGGIVGDEIINSTANGLAVAFCM